MKTAKQLYYEANRERIIAKAKLWAQKNKERRAKIRRKWDAENKAKRAASAKRRYERRKATDIEVLRALWRRDAERWQRKNPERLAFFKKRSRERWIARDPEAARLRFIKNATRRRARMLASSMGYVDYARIVATHGTICHICGKEIPKGNLEFDHVIPLARGGAHTEENIRPAHKKCNRRKHLRSVDVTRAELGALL